MGGVHQLQEHFEAPSTFVPSKFQPDLILRKEVAHAISVCPHCRVMPSQACLFTASVLTCRTGLGDVKSPGKHHGFMGNEKGASSEVRLDPSRSCEHYLILFSLGRTIRGHRAQILGHLSNDRPLYFALSGGRVMTWRTVSFQGE